MLEKMQGYIKVGGEADLGWEQGNKCSFSPGGPEGGWVQTDEGLHLGVGC